MPDPKARPRRARIADVHALARSMPHVTVYRESTDHPVYQVGSKSFVFFRTPRPDAVNPETGQRYDDVIVFWVLDESDKLALVQDERGPFFTTDHFDGHPSVLLRASRIGELRYDELAEVVEDAWLAQASPRRRSQWLGTQSVSGAAPDRPRRVTAERHRPGADRPARATPSGPKAPRPAR